MAEAVPYPGKLFHGIAHEVTEEDMTKLDVLEAMYTRSPCKLRFYDNTIAVGSVYVRNNDQSDFNMVNSLPSERYLELLISGCE
eukprot:CAMPEP_0182417100 /NCGR_PEP_ID=MMETSP1167-20130531/1516_1 /TAXON_ID=2988 /ORGANISM="Mallomonas Sp, Strain CCMP3275" /LENGTH=83 /DNA_ID=CAMNT_0024590407 /DNA_START=139 /DNA_END=387 /DNA_ORIENTATION=-